jgi:hypothetical protein
MATDFIREFDQAVQPVFDAIDGAFQTGKVDPESLTEAINSHIDWWVDELSARPGCPCAGTDDEEGCPHA